MLGSATFCKELDPRYGDLATCTVVTFARGNAQFAHVLSIREQISIWALLGCFCFSRNITEGVPYWDPRPLQGARAQGALATSPW